MRVICLIILLFAVIVLAVDLNKILKQYRKEMSEIKNQIENLKSDRRR